MGNYKVLLIDDEEELVNTLVERLAFRGIEAEALTCGSDALDRLREKKFDVVVVDMKMPGLSGPDVIDFIREEHPGVKILMITGHVSGQAEKIEVPEGAHDVLLKPFKIDTLIAKINEALKGMEKDGE